MKQKNLLFIPFILGLGISLFSCNIGDKGNISTFPAGPAVVDFSMSMGGTIIRTSYGYCAAPTLPLEYAYSGECLVLSFTIDYDNQPSSEFATASNIVVYERLSPFQFLSGQNNPSDVGDYKLPISSAEIIDIIDGKTFFGITAKDNGPRYRLIYNSEEPDSAGIKNLYLQAQQLSAANSDVGKYQVCDIDNFVQQYGRDTTIVSSGSSTGFKYVRTNLKYFTGMSGETPVYKMANDISKPIYFITPK